ncbi:hypothetical protein WUBG_16212 [Wuchereria bancrofti]|uniref:Uncharacterized protein n=1 Tax=Wuchereria bancrofti TaxID=6293 RepID=J9AFP4_WUCBA|nr:hypothetical protein WUBG_16212 [Wuchereria bancrofti]
MSSTGRIFFISVRIEKMLNILALPVESTVALRTIVHSRRLLLNCKEKDFKVLIAIVQFQLAQTKAIGKQLETESQKFNQPNRRRRKRQPQHAAVPKQAYILKSNLVQW